MNPLKIGGIQTQLLSGNEIRVVHLSKFLRKLSAVCVSPVLQADAAQRLWSFTINVRADWRAVTLHYAFQTC